MAQDAQNRLTILVVEDEWFVRLAIMEFLEARDCAVIEARNGEAAAEILRAQDGIDVVFTDIRLGGRLNGWDVGEISRQAHPGASVIYTSGAIALPERTVDGSVFLPKPYAPEAVLAACRRLAAGQS